MIGDVTEGYTRSRVTRPKAFSWILLADKITMKKKARIPHPLKFGSKIVFLHLIILNNKLDCKLFYSPS